MSRSIKSSLQACSGDAVTASERDTLSIVIPTKNSAELLKGCLESAAFADEILVIDMYSTDATPEICARYPQCRLIQRAGYIFANVNHGFEQATGDWVMRLDSDERITPELAAEVKRILTEPPHGVTGYEFWERLVILGREQRNGFGTKHYRKMMFRRGAARYPVRSEHEDLETSGTWLRTSNGYLHLNYTSVAQYLEKTNYYTDKDVRREPLPDQPPPVREALIETLRAFYLNYLKKRGYRDGWVGFLDASMRGVYQLVQWAKRRERYERETGDRRA
jgi:glycosyltransferase involved in cell wall biosynthesis